MATVGALRSWPRTTRSPLPSVKRSTASAGFGMPLLVVLDAVAVRFAAVVVFLVVAMWATTLDPRQLGETGDEHLHHEVVRPRLLPAQIEVGFGEEADRPTDLRAAEASGLRQRLLRRERAALQSEHL